MTKDLNRGITSITYDLLGNPTKVTMKDGNNVEYVYAADGTRLKATHNTKLSGGRYSSRDRYYRGNLIFVRSNDKLPYTVLVPGGYYFYESADDAFYLSLYVQDYQGNNRAELYNGNYIFEQTHYYPFGGIIGDLSSTSSYNAGNDFKYSGKELDRNFGLDMYDFHARQYGADVPWFTKPDPMSEKFYWVSPYSYCLGNPVNMIDPTGFAPDTLESAQLSDDVYDATLGEGPGKWYCVSKSNGGSFKWAIYAKGQEDDLEYVLAFAGTDDTYDILTDLYQGLGLIDGNAADYDCTEYGKAIELAQAFVSFINGNEGTIVGHSLGASLGTIAALSTQTKAMVFNPASIHDNTIETFNIDTSNHESLVSTFVVDGEFLSYFNYITPSSKVYGTTTRIPSVPNDWFWNRHKITNTINAIKLWNTK